MFWLWAVPLNCAAHLFEWNDGEWWYDGDDVLTATPFEHDNMAFTAKFLVQIEKWLIIQALRYGFDSKLYRFVISND